LGDHHLAIAVGSVRAARIAPAAVLGVLRDLDLERLISRERCRDPDLAVAMLCRLGIARPRIGR